MVPLEPAPRSIDPGVRVGHVHLRSSDIDRAKELHVGVLGFDVVAEERGVPGWATTGDILFRARTPPSSRARSPPDESRQPAERAASGYDGRSAAAVRSDA